MIKKKWKEEGTKDLGLFYRPISLLLNHSNEGIGKPIAEKSRILEKKDKELEKIKISSIRTFSLLEQKQRNLSLLLTILNSLFKNQFY